MIRTLATAGDVNGDGYSDTIVGAHLYDNGQPDEGRAYVYLGSASGLAATPAWSAESDQASASFGISVATAGDVNGDGYSDVIIGAYFYDNGETDEGRAYVYFGSGSGPDTTPAGTAEGDQASARLGNSVATVGDVNGDGYSDVIRIASSILPRSAGPLHDCPSPRGPPSIARASCDSDPLPLFMDSSPARGILEAGIFRMARILIVDDDPKTVATLKLYLEDAGYEVLEAFDGRQALMRARALPPPDLVVLDRMLPHMDGLSVCRTLRSESDVPVIMLTARTTEADRLEGLDQGADDYVPKPFSPRELVARVRAVLRRSAGGADDRPPIRVAGLSIDTDRHEVTVQGRVVPLTPREFHLLAALARSPGRAFTREQLAERALGPDFEGLDRTIDAHIMNLRRKIEPDPQKPTYILTVFGVGYRFTDRRGAA